jgi:hypothetical protein
MKKIRFKKLKINWKKFLNYIFLIFLSSAILLTFLIALPLTEELTNVTAFDLNVANDFWSKEYILDVDSEEAADIRKTKNILFKRLNDYGVEEVSVSQQNDSLKVVVKTTKSQTYVDELVRNPYRYNIVTRKEDVDFDSEENQLAPYLEENYNETPFDASTFRNIYITELPSSSGEDAYFGIVKPWPHKTRNFKKFLEEYEGESVGVNIDGFVTPVQISDLSTFAIPISGEKDQVEAIDILYNSGIIPTSYEVLEQNTLEVNKVNINYIEVTIVLFVSIILLYIYIYFSKIYSTNMIFRSMFATLFSLAFFLTFLKFTAIPVHIFILIIDAILLIALTNMFEQNDESRLNILVGSMIIAVIFAFLGIGYLKVLGNHLIIISITSILSVIIGNFYINKVLEYFKK